MKKTREITKKTKPEYKQCRVWKPMPQSPRASERRGRPNDIGKHTHYGPGFAPVGIVKVDRNGEPITPRLVCWHSTQETPWARKAKTRAKNKRARVARKLNRR